jgi:cytochrome c553
MPSGHIPVATTAQCGNCHTSNFVDTPTLTNIHAFAQSTTTNCVQCHSAASAAQFVVKTPIVTPDGNHIPMGSLSCESCHMGAQSSIKGAAVKTGDKFANSLFNHSGISTGCNACHGVTVDATTFPGIPNIKAISYDIAPVHMRVPSAIGCEVCHTNSVPIGQVPAAGMKTFAGASFTHSGITTDCAKCHGPSITPASFLGSPNIVVMPATISGGHIPSSTVCESCHLGSTPSALIAGSATKTTGPGTGFKVALPASSTIHANSDTTSCNVCHESGKDWMSVATYTRGPSNTPSAGALFTGFQTRPVAGGGTYSVNDSSHVGVGVGDCSNCHTGYTGFGPPVAPSNHIPYTSGTSCSSCHTVANFATMPAYGDIHKYAQSATTNCVQCHSTANAGIYNQLAGMGGKLVKPATNHIAMASLSCESCHVASLTGLTSSTTSFAAGKYSHSGVTSGCNACHVSGTGPFQGTLSIVVMPPTTGPAASTQHLPTSTTCETCHLGSTPSTLVAAVATNTAATSTFATPVPTAAMNHSGVTASCNVCHEAGGSSTSDVWMNMAAYPITTSAPFKGFQVRPSTAGMFRVADGAHPTGGDCSSCHVGFVDFSAAVKPANHIPTSSASTCQSCHTSSDYSVMPSLTNIHLYAPSTTTNCVQCHSATNADTYNVLAGMKGLLVKPPATHVAMGSLGCESCHVGANSSITAALPVKDGAKFTNSAYSHSGVTSGCANCHGDGVTALSFAGQTPKPIPAGHVPNTGNADCVACHTTAPSALIAYSGAVAGSANTFATTKYSHSGITSSCQTCHAGGTSYVGITNMVV